MRHKEGEQEDLPRVGDGRAKDDGSGFVTSSYYGNSAKAGKDIILLGSKE